MLQGARLINLSLGLLLPWGIDPKGQGGGPVLQGASAKGPPRAGLQLLRLIGAPIVSPCCGGLCDKAP